MENPKFLHSWQQKKTLKEQYKICMKWFVILEIKSFDFVMIDKTLTFTDTS